MLAIGERRQRVVETAMSYIGTPYITGGRVKGPNGGVDCLTFLAGVFEDAGEIERLPIPHYPPDWHMHQSIEHYLFGKDDTPGVLHFCTEVAAAPERAPLPGDIVMWKFGHCYSHAAIVTQWPMVIHAYARRKVGLDDAERYSVLARVHEFTKDRGQLRPRKFFTKKDWI